VFTGTGYEVERRPRQWVQIPQHVMNELGRHYAGQGTEQARLQNAELLGRIAKVLRPVVEEAAE
jgi:hypothetical protein